MEEKISEARAEELIKEILAQKEVKKSAEDYIEGAKKEVNTFMVQNDLTEFKTSSGIVKIADSVRKGLDKEKVQAEVVKVNDKQTDHIDMNTLYKESDVHIVSIKATKEDIKEDNKEER